MNLLEYFLNDRCHTNAQPIKEHFLQTSLCELQDWIKKE